MEAFFKQSDFTSRRPLTLVPLCGECGLFKTCQSPKMEPSGKGQKGILIVGEAPGKTEDDQGVQFVGKTGKRLRHTLLKLGIDPNRDCIFTNALICRPPKNEIPENKYEKAINACRPNLLRAIEQYNPKVIILLGRTACKSYLGHVWKEEVGSVERWAGFQIPCQKPNVWICPTWHPSFVERADDRVLDRMWESHLKAAVEITNRPWEKVPDFTSKVICLMDPDHAADFIRDQRPTAISFDYETNMLKPDSQKARIFCCSICFDGRVTIAYPWHGNAIKATLELLWNKRVMKVGFNIKLENRWTLSKYGKGVRNWIWDGMIASHVLDNRPGITSLKFQAFVRFGMPNYDAVVRPYLTQSGGGNSPNRIDQISLPRLIEYCALDSYLEWKVAKQQMKELGRVRM